MIKRLTALALVILLFALPITAMAAMTDMTLTMAYMECYFTCGCSRVGTGTMIGRYGLVTAAHNLYCYMHGKQLNYCNFYFGAKPDGSYWYKYEGNFTYRAYNAFTHGYNSQDDIGYVIFESPVGNYTGWCAPTAGSDWYLNEEYMNMLTYDGSRNLKNIFEIMYVDSPLEVYWPGQIEGLAAGGGPVYFWYEGLEYPQIVAVYTAQDTAGNSYGRRLTEDIINDMRDDGVFN